MPTLLQAFPISVSCTVELVDSAAGEPPQRLVLKKALADASNQITTRFETAAQILPRLNTRHAPKLRASGLDHDAAYLLMDWVAGETLEEVMRRGALPQQQLVSIGTALARALYAIHLQHTVHLHLLPSHVMLTPTGQAVLLSFGLAHHRECPDLLPGPEWVLAVSSDWMAPEQAYQVRDDARSDQWALGALMYQMAVGHPSFVDPAEPELVSPLNHRLWKDPVPLRRLRPDLPAWLQEVIHRCLEVAPSDRYDHCGQIAWALTHPESVALDPARARVKPLPLWHTLSRWLKHQRDPVHALKGLRHQTGEQAPLIVLALDPDAVEGELPQYLREVTRRVMASEVHGHLACLTVVEAPLESAAADAESQSFRQGRQALRLWAKPLLLPATRLSFHVFEGGDPLDHLLRFTAEHQADLLIMGCSRRDDRSDRVWPPLMSRVVAEAGCSVYVVRPSEETRPAEQPV
jgi:nucleotide-binding universal stress UspA family protein